MPWKLRQYECEDCGHTVRRNRKSTDPLICEDCGKDRKLLTLRARDRPVAFQVDSDGEVTST
jgi:DNA-directed RNA polymerase subunit RPC12/RpoP